MSEMEANAGFSGGFGIKKETSANVAATPPTNFLEIESETFDEVRNFLDTQGIDGTRSRSKHRSAPTTLDPKGGFVINGVKGGDLDLLIELLLGNYGSGTGYLGDALPTFTTVVKKTPKYDVYAGCKMLSGIFESSQDAQALKASFEALAMSLTEGTAPSFGTPTYVNEIPLTHVRGTFTVGSTAVNVQSSKLSIVNKIADNIYRNSQTRLAVPEIGEREVSGELALDWNAANYTALMTPWRSGTYAEYRAEYTNGAHVVTFVFPNCRFPSERGKIGNKELIAMPVKFEARSSGPGQRDEVQIYVRDVV